MLSTTTVATVVAILAVVALLVTLVHAGNRQIDAELRHFDDTQNLGAAEKLIDKLLDERHAFAVENQRLLVRNRLQSCRITDLELALTRAHREAEQLVSSGEDAAIARAHELFAQD